MERKFEVKREGDWIAVYLLEGEYKRIWYDFEVTKRTDPLYWKLHLSHKIWYPEVKEEVEKLIDEMTGTKSNRYVSRFLDEMQTRYENAVNDSNDEKAKLIKEIIKLLETYVN